MKLSINQPYFFPYLGYFSLLHRTDKFVVFDITKYTSKSWMTRNTIKNDAYIKVPVKKAEIVKDVIALPWKERVLNQLKIYADSPYYYEVTELVERVDGRTLVDVNLSALELVCRYLGVKLDYICASWLDIPKCDTWEWAPVISEILRADEYMNLPGGRDKFDPKDFEKRGIELSFTDKYPSGSILHHMMEKSPDEILSLL